MFKCDLTSGYHHIYIHKDHQSYLGFSWKFKNKIKYFIFRVLPFGLPTAGHVFSKVLRPMVKFWRAQGFQVIFYLDDGWGVESDFDSCSLLSNTVRRDLLSAGFFINEEKSQWCPTKKLTWIGFKWDLNNSTLEFPCETIVRFNNDIKAIDNSHNAITARLLARITGKIISFMPSLGNICRIMSRNMLMLITTSHYWDEKVYLTEEAIAELQFWLNNCHLLPRKRLFSQNVLPDKIVYTDASNFACAGYTIYIESS